MRNDATSRTGMRLLSLISSRSFGSVGFPFDEGMIACRQCVEQVRAGATVRQGRSVITDQRLNEATKMMQEQVAGCAT
jgi:hypothetical protein